MEDESEGRVANLDLAETWVCNDLKTPYVGTHSWAC
jgi:hypothetical protein